MIITILGTGDPLGIPVMSCECKYCKTSSPRTRPAVLVESKGKKMIFDTNPDIRQQIIKNRAFDFSDVFITHFHFDHFYGIGEFSQLSFLKKKQNFKIRANRSVIEDLNKNFSWMDFPVEEMNHGDNVQIGKSSVEAVRIVHSPITETHAYVIREGKKKVVYMPDFKGFENEESKKKLMDADVLITDGMYIMGKYINDDDHLGGEELLETIISLRAKKVYIMAISEHFYQMTAKEMQKKLPKNFTIPKDGMKIKLI